MILVSFVISKNMGVLNFFLCVYFKSKYFSYTFRYRLRMFIIEKLIVHTSEDKKKKVSLSQFSTLPITCMTTTRGQHCSALLGIASIKFLTSFLSIVRHSCCNIWCLYTRILSSRFRSRKRDSLLNQILRQFPECSAP